MKKIARIMLLPLAVVLTVALASCTLFPATSEPPELTADRTAVAPGETVTLTATVAEEVEDAFFVYEITSGARLATLDPAGTLKVSADAKTGDKITVVAKYNNVVSNTVTVNVVIMPQSIEISADKYEIGTGKSATLSAKILPEGAWQNGLVWEITSGEDDAQIIGKRVSVLEGADAGAKVKVVGKIGELVSNELTFTVTASMFDDLLLLHVSSNTITVDSSSATPAILTATVYNHKFQELDMNVIFEIESGEEYISLSTENNSCSLSAKAHGTAVVRATVEGTTTSSLAMINSIVPPESLALPEVFAEREEYAYNFSMADKLPFAPIPVGEGACPDYELTFKDESGGTKNVATYADGKITFLKTGLITVTARSVSGADVEAELSYTFNVNNGINVYTFEQLKSLVESDAYNGQTINITAFEKPSAAYGYELVPAYCLADTQELDALLDGIASISAIDKSLTVNGNRHTINLSAQRGYTSSEHTEPMLPAALRVIPSNGNKGTYSVRLYDLEIIGNCPANFAGELKPSDGSLLAYGVDFAGIEIGQSAAADTAVYTLEMKGVGISGFFNGITLNHIVDDGLLEDVHAYNCFANGITVESSRITLKNLRYSMCGAAGVELRAKNSNKAGKSFNQNQRVTVIGVTDGINMTDGTSRYMQSLMLELADSEVSLAEIIASALSEYAAEADIYSSLVDANGKYALIAIAPADPLASEENRTELDCRTAVAIGSLTAKDTEHEYITLDIAPGDGSPATRLLLANLNYEAD